MKETAAERTARFDAAMAARAAESAAYVASRKAAKARTMAPDVQARLKAQQDADFAFLKGGR